VGTAQYLSPEQARGGEVDPRSDLYSLGVVLYEMVTGRLPFESDTAMGIILHHLQTPPPSPRDVRPDLGIPEPLAAILMRALEKDPENRFASAVAMASALDEVLALPLPERPPAAGVPGVPARPATPVPVPSDIEFHETRVMPKTPPVGGRTPIPTAAGPMGAAPAAALRTPPPISTPAPVATPVPSRTVVGHAGATATPPPLPPPTSVFTPPPARRRRRQWWIAIAVMAVAFSLRYRASDHDPSRHGGPEPPSPASPADADADERAQATHDREIAAGIKRGLHALSRNERADVQVEVDEGVVTLTGHASRAAAAKAEEIARSVDGVREVLNMIETPEQEMGGNPVGPPGAGAPSPGFSIPGLPAIPGFPAHPRGRPSADPREVERLLREARDAMKAQEAGEAMGKFTAVLAMDPTNKEAREGLEAATLLLGDTIRRHIGHPPAPPPPSPSPSR
jgi:BON domain-containing protein/protein kinase-like protein